MDKSSSQFADLLRAICEKDLRSGSSHPVLEELRAYEAEELSTEEMDRVQGHMALCRDCTDIVLMLTDVRRQLEAGRRRSASFAWSGPAYAVAAGVTVVLIASMFWWWSPQEPHANIYFDTLDPAETPAAELRRDLPLGAAIHEVAIPKEADSVLLILGLGEAHVFDYYRLEMRDLSGSAGEVVWTTEQLRRMPAGNFSVEIPVGYLPVGDYSMLLSGIEQGQFRAVAEYFVRIGQAP